MKTTTPVLELAGDRVIRGRKMLGTLVPAPTAFDMVVRFPPCPICGKQVALEDTLLHRYTCRKIGEGQLRCRMGEWLLPKVKERQDHNGDVAELMAILKGIRGGAKCLKS